MIFFFLLLPLPSCLPPSLLSSLLIPSFFTLFSYSLIFRVDLSFPSKFTFHSRLNPKQVPKLQPRSPGHFSLEEKKKHEDKDVGLGFGAMNTTEFTFPSSKCKFSQFQRRKNCNRQKPDEALVNHRLQVLFLPFCKLENWIIVIMINKTQGQRRTSIIISWGRPWLLWTEAPTFSHVSPSPWKIKGYE